MTDVVNLYSQLLELEPARLAGRTFNFGFENLKVIEIARLIQQELADLNVEIRVTDTLDKRDYHISSAKILKELGYQPVSSIRQEVASLRQALEGGAFPDIDAPAHYNLKCMKLARDAGPYRFLSR
jgi:nucleoside-diphosphate-sugar epimerase